MSESERHEVIRRNEYPASVRLEMRDMRGEGDLWVVEGSIRYDDGPGQPAVNILEFRGDKVARETIYVTEPWEVPEWRARWRAAPWPGRSPRP